MKRIETMNSGYVGAVGDIAKEFKSGRRRRLFMMGEWRRAAGPDAIENTPAGPRPNRGAGVQVTAPARGERSFHVFYMFLRGLAITAPATAAALRLRGPVEYRYLGGVSAGGGAGEVPDAAARAAMEAASEAATAHEGDRTDAEQVLASHTHRLPLRRPTSRVLRTPPRGRSRLQSAAASHPNRTYDASRSSHIRARALLMRQLAFRLS